MLWIVKFGVLTENWEFSGELVLDWWGKANIFCKKSILVVRAEKWNFHPKPVSKNAVLRLFLLNEVFEDPQKRLLRWPHVTDENPVYICFLNPYLLLHKIAQNFYYLNFSHRWQCKVWAAAGELIIWHLMITAITNGRNRNELGILWCGTGREVGSSWQSCLLTFPADQVNSLSYLIMTLAALDGVRQISFCISKWFVTKCDLMKCVHREKRSPSIRGSWARMEIWYMHGTGRAQIASFILGSKELSIVTKSVRCSE